jgi:hypothetical protein
MSNLSNKEMMRLASRAKAIEIMHKLDSEIEHLTNQLAQTKDAQQKSHCHKCSNLSIKMIEKKLEACIQARSRYPSSKKQAST